MAQGGPAVLALALLVLGGPASAGSSPARDLADEVRTADESRLPELRARLAALEPKDFAAWYALGLLSRRQGNSPEAAEDMKRALDLRPGDPEAEGELALDDDDMGRYEEEISLLRKAIERRPREYPLYPRLAKVYARLGRAAEAKETYARARALGGKAAAAYIEEGYFDLRSGEAARARRDFQEAIAVDTSSPFGYHHLGAYYMADRRYPEAEKSFRRALKKLLADPKASDADVVHTMVHLGRAIAAQGRYSEAEAALLRARERARAEGINPPLVVWSLRELGDVYVSEGKYAEAEDSYKRAVSACGERSRCPSSEAVKPLVALGSLYLKQGRKADAAAAAAQAEKVCEDSAFGEALFDALAVLSDFYRRLGDAAKSASVYRLLEPMRRANPDNPMLIAVERDLAGIAASQGLLREAERHDLKAIELAERNRSWKVEADVRESLAGVYEKEGGREADAAAAREQARSLRSRP